MVESLRSESNLPRPRFELPKERGYELRSFTVASPAQTSILSDPAWLAVFLAALALGLSALQTLGSYGAIKKGAQEASADLARLRDGAKERAKAVVAAVQGLSARQREDLELGIALFLEQFANSPQRFYPLLIRASHLASVLRRGNDLPVVNVERLENDA